MQVGVRRPYPGKRRAPQSGGGDAPPERGRRATAPPP